jgi:hypothetical protein
MTEPNDEATEPDEQPWGQSLGVRRDCAPHRGDQLTRWADRALIGHLVSFLCLPVSFVAMPISLICLVVVLLCEFILAVS